jgi:hypothetical protein
MPRAFAALGCCASYPICVQYWLDLFTPETWAEAAAIGFSVTGFRQTRWPIVQRVRPGDTFVCYLTRVSRFSGLLEATSGGFEDTTPIWKSDPFPARVKTRPIIALNPEAAVPFDGIANRLSSATSWRGYIRGSPMLLPPQDGDVIVDALEKASVGAQVWTPTSAVRESAETLRSDVSIAAPTVPEPEPSDRPHAKVQWQLISLGKALNLDVHVARNDRGLKHEGQPFAGVTLKTLPAVFDPLSRKILELIDVLWLDRNQIVCAFEVEQSTDIHSGLLRMTDLLAVQPHTNIRLYLVAPDERRSKVIREVNRPTFYYADRPLYTVCKYIAYSRLQKELADSQPYWQYMKYDFIDQLAESCETSQPEVDE